MTRIDVAKKFVLFLLTAAFSGFVAGAELATPGNAPIPVERFFSKPAMQRVILSPSGRWVASLVLSANDRVNIQVLDLDGVEPPRVVQASAEDDVYWFQWVSDDWLVFSLDDTGFKRDLFYGPGLFAMRRDGSDLRMLVDRGPGDQSVNSLRGPRSTPVNVLPPKFGYLGLGAPGSLTVILGERDRDVNWEYSHTRFRELNIVTRKWERLGEDAPKASGWLFDAQGRLRLVRQRDDKQIKYLWSDLDAAGKPGPWREIATMTALDETWYPAYIDQRGDLYVTTFDAQGFTELRKFDTAARKPADQVLLTTPGFSTDVSSITSVAGGPVVGARLAVDSATTVWFDAKLKALQDRVDARWPGRVNLMQCRPCDDPKRLLVFSYADNDPGQYLLFYPAKNEWQHLGAMRPDIDQAKMARQDFERIRARDGRDLPLWITRTAAKAGAAAPAPAPTVVLVHGGPNARGSSWLWDSEAQFLASRGYVVIEPEFRGSTGYGEQHFRAGWRQWGTGMIDDITDSVRYAVKAGLVDPKRVCVMGGSYGGYASLMSLVKEPDMYRCGISFAGLSDLRNRYDFFWSDLSLYGRKVVMPILMGDPDTDAAMFVATSPVEQVQRIKAPVLLVHGDSDYRVPLENAERMRDALKNAGKDFEWVLYQDEGHGFSKPANELDYWRRVEAFLAKHLR
jgi:dipeptidyl aminopeptidase/acylaminoacyl peptidase